MSTVKIILLEKPLNDDTVGRPPHPGRIQLWADSSGALHKTDDDGSDAILAAGGDINTASNVGVGGVGVFDAKVGNDLQFKNINSSSASIVVTDDAANNEIDISLNPSAIDISDLSGSLTGSPSTFAGYDNSGDLYSIPGFGINSSDGLQANHTYAPAGGVGTEALHTINLNIEPSANSPDRSANVLAISANIDNLDSGFTFGTNGNATRLLNLSAANIATGDSGEINFINQYFNIGNGVDPVSVKGFSYAYGFGNVNANATINGSMQGYGFQPSINAAATLTSSASVTAFYDAANIETAMATGYTSANFSPSLLSIPNNNNLTGININPTVDEFIGNAGFTGIAVAGIFSDFGATGGINAINISPTTTNAKYANGLVVNMNNASMYAGVASSIVIQDLTLTFNAVGDNDATTIQYIDDATAGSETASYSAPNIVVHIESGVSTATQVKAALDADLTISTNITTTISGVASDPQVTQAATNFTGGENAGTKKAADFTGDVSINGGLSFTGGLSVGQIEAFYAVNPVDGGGTPTTLHGLITSVTALNGVTVANADTIGVNTAMLITLEDNSVTTSGAFSLGLSALALPCVVQTHTGSTLDYMSGAVYAISFDGASTGGTIDTINISRCVAVPNGITTVNKLRGYYYHEPFGGVGTVRHGIYMQDAPENYLESSLLIGGTPLSDDTVTNSSVALEIKSTTKAAVEARMTTAQRDALTAINGMKIYNVTTDKFQGYAAGAWVDLH